ncbi:MAG: YciI family protein [Planctomycetota bacterium]
MRQVFACIWRAHEPDATFKQEEFEKRIPRLMSWLKDLKAKGKLVACGGGGFSTHAGGLTLLAAETPEEAKMLSDGTPMNEIGATEIFLWDCFYADLVHRKNEEKLKS